VAERATQTKGNQMSDLATATHFDFWVPNSVTTLEEFLAHHAGKRFNIYTRTVSYFNYYAEIPAGTHHVKGRKYRGRNKFHIGMVENIQTVCINDLTMPSCWLDKTGGIHN